MPCSSAIPRIRTCIAARVPSTCQRCNPRCVALFDAHCGPRGTSHHRQPVIKTDSNVFHIFRNGVRIPRISATQSTGMLPSSLRHGGHPRSVATLDRMISLGSLLLSMAVGLCGSLFRGVATRAAEALLTEETGTKTIGQRRIALVTRSNATLGMSA